MNEQQRPRVLVCGVRPEIEVQLRDLDPTVAPTVVFADYEAIEPLEYDCVVTMVPPAHPLPDALLSTPTTTHYPWDQRFRSHLSILQVVGPDGEGEEELDFRPPAGKVMPDATVVADRGVVGSHVTYAQGLSPELDALAKRYLAPAAEQRDKHVVFRQQVRSRWPIDDEPIDRFDLRPLLYGPRHEVLAATYERNDDASVWLLPLDLIGDIREWVSAAFHEWHDLYPKRFLSVGDWRSSPAWYTPKEDLITNQLSERREQFEDATQAYEQDCAALEDQMESVRIQADEYERALLTTTGTELETAVLQALSELGFQVQHMDEVWGQNPRREDYRVADPDTSGWVALGEAKGFTKGVNETGIQRLDRWAKHYALETRTLPDRLWYIANQFLLDDPSKRPVPLHARDDVVDVFAEDGGLVIDTRALFRLVVAVQQHPQHKEDLRAFLRGRTGRLTEEDAVAEIDRLIGAS